jgi:hypothetical protein
MVQTFRLLVMNMLQKLSAPGPTDLPGRWIITTGMSTFRVGGIFNPTHCLAIFTTPTLYRAIKREPRKRNQKINVVPTQTN